MSEIPKARPYFSERQGRGPLAEPLPFDSLKKLIVSSLDDFRGHGYFQEAFGIECVDGDRPGTLGSNPDAHFLRTIMRQGIWPYWEVAQVELDIWVAPWEEWEADTLFDVAEVLHDLVSKPIEGEYHASTSAAGTTRHSTGPKGRRSSGRG
jgi:hypothetical protein